MIGDTAGMIGARSAVTAWPGLGPLTLAAPIAKGFLSNSWTPTCCGRRYRKRLDRCSCGDCSWAVACTKGFLHPPSGPASGGAVHATGRSQTALIRATGVGAGLGA